MSHYSFYLYNYPQWNKRTWMLTELLKEIRLIIAGYFIQPPRCFSLTRDPTFFVVGYSKYSSKWRGSWNACFNNPLFVWCKNSIFISLVILSTPVFHTWRKNSLFYISCNIFNTCLPHFSYTNKLHQGNSHSLIISLVERLKILYGS